MSNKSLDRLKKINTEITSLMDKGWKHISIIDTVDKFHDEKGEITSIILTDVHGSKYSVDFKLLNDSNIKPGGGILFKYERISRSPVMSVVDETCKIISKDDVNNIFAGND